ncbi:RNA polymerase sigma factor [Virgibacillus ainsalahensis]
MTNKKSTFEEIYQQNKRRIHYQIHRLNLRDPQQEYFQEGLCAMWNAYRKYDPDKGPMATYFNFMIRNRLIDLLRKESREKQHLQTILEQYNTEDRNIQPPIERSHTPTALSELLSDNPTLLRQLKSRLTTNQWKWVYYAVNEDMSIKDIAIQENTTADAVKSWGRQVRRKLRTDEFRQMLTNNE